MSTVAVIGATGTAGSRVTGRLKGNGDTIVEISRSHGVDLISGEGLAEALEGVEVAIDVSNVLPRDDNLDITEALAAATDNVVDACAATGVGRLVLLTIAGVEKSVFDGFPYYVAKRRQEDIVLHSGVRSTIVKSTQWHEFAANPAAVTFTRDAVVVQDWLIQPVAADSVADVLVVAALGSHCAPRAITGPDVIRLPELTSRMLRRYGDHRRVRVEDPPLAALANGALVASADAAVIGPSVDTWLQGIGASDDRVERS